LGGVRFLIRRRSTPAKINNPEPSTARPAGSATAAPPEAKVPDDPPDVSLPMVMESLNVPLGSRNCTEMSPSEPVLNWKPGQVNVNGLSEPSTNVVVPAGTQNVPEPE